MNHDINRKTTSCIFFKLRNVHNLNITIKENSHGDT